MLHPDHQFPSIPYQAFDTQVTKAELRQANAWLAKKHTEAEVALMDTLSGTRKKNYNKKTEALALINDAKKIYNLEKNWRLEGNKIILSDLIKLSETGKETFGLRKQNKLNKVQAIYLASCKSVHEDISLYF